MKTLHLLRLALTAWAAGSVHADSLSYSERLTETVRTNEGFLEVRTSSSATLEAAVTARGIGRASFNDETFVELQLGDELVLSGTLGEADELDASHAVFKQRDDEDRVIGQLRVERSGDTLTLSGTRRGSIVAGEYLGVPGPFSGRLELVIRLDEFEIERRIPYRGTNAITHPTIQGPEGPEEFELNNVRLVGMGDSEPPTLTIDKPTPNQRWTNDSFTVVGRVSDNVGVETVLLSVNGSDFEPIFDYTGTARWTNEIFLEPGTNTIRARCIDFGGLRSSIASVQAFYAVPATFHFTLGGSGRGRVLGPADGATLDLNRGYKLTAVPEPGSRFVAWTGDIVGLNTNLSFLMPPELSVQANFEDVARPSLAILFPTNNARLTGQTSLALYGRAADNIGVTQVVVSVNGSGFAPVLDYAGATGWTNVINVVPGTNVVLAHSIDASGKRSATNRVTFFNSVPGNLTLRVEPTNGGFITGIRNTQAVEIGRSYALTARPNSNFFFTGWSGETNSSNAVLKFLMPETLTLQANFVTNKFLAVRGVYNGLFGPANVDEAEAAGAPAPTMQVHPTNAGYFTLTLGANGQIAGKLIFAATNHSITGRCDLAGHALARSTRPGGPSLDLQFDLQDTPNEELTRKVAGTVTMGALVAGLRGDQAGYYRGGMGRHTFLIPSPTATPAPARPGGDGAGIATISTIGTLTLAGALGDGTPFSQATTLSQNGDWPIFAALYGGKGLLWGWGSVSTNQTPLAFRATDVVWFKPPGLPGKFYTNGFPELVEIDGARYTRPGRGTNVLNWTNGILRLDAGNLQNPFTSEIVWRTNKLVVITNTISLRLTNDLARGLFGGTFVHPVTQRVTPFTGAYLQLDSPDLGWAGGWFRGTNETGYVEIVPLALAF